MPTISASKYGRAKKSEDDVSAFTASEADNNNDDDEDLQSTITHRVSLAEENEQLKADVVRLKKKLARLQESQQQQPKKQQLLPSSLRQAATDNRRRPRPPAIPPIPKHSHRKLSGIALNDTNEVVGPMFDLETHESGRGLHHRRNKYGYGHSNGATSPQQQDGLWSRFITATGASSSLTNIRDDEIETFLGTSENNYGDDTNDCDNVDVSFRAQVQDRASWLVGLLVLQSMSSFIIGRNESLLQHHAIIVRFLTMLVGAGGNAGNQASVRVIRGLAVGTVSDDNFKEFLSNELKMALTLSVIIGVAGCIRAAVFLTPIVETLAITTSLLFIVFISIVLGALLPLAMKYVRIDPAHSSTTIQVIMDILGVLITVHVCAAILDSALHTKMSADTGDDTLRKTMETPN